MRNVWAVVAGFLITGLIRYSVEYVNGLYWLPEGVNWLSMEDMIEVISTLPPIAVVPNIIGLIIALYVGPFATGRVARTGSPNPGYIVAALFLLQEIVFQLFVPQPLWPIFIGMLVLGFIGYLGAKAGARSPKPKRS